MKQPDWRAAGLRMQIMARRSGLIPALACSLFVLGCAAGLALLVPPDTESAALVEALREARQRLRSTARPAAEVDGPQRALAAFEQVLGDPASVEPALRSLFDAATQAGLALEQGEYRWLADRASGTERYQMRFTTKGRYAAVRAFCERVLLALPVASMDELSLRREAIDDEVVVASVQFSLHLQGLAPDAAASSGSPP